MTINEINEFYVLDKGAAVLLRFTLMIKLCLL